MSRIWNGREMRRVMKTGGCLARIWEASCVTEMGRVGLHSCGVEPRGGVGSRRGRALGCKAEWRWFGRAIGERAISLPGDFQGQSGWPGEDLLV